MYADVIIDISHEQLDKTFQYAVPDELADVIETVSIYGEKIKGRIIKENINTVIIEGTDGRQHVVRNERIGKKIAKRDKKHAQGFNRSQVEGYGQAPDKRAVHHYGRGPRVAGGN